MGRASSEAVPVVVTAAHTNKVVVSRVEAANMFRRTTPMRPLRAVMNDDIKCVTSDMTATASGTIDEPEPRDTQPSIPCERDLQPSIPCERDLQPSIPRERDTQPSPPPSEALRDSPAHDASHDCEPSLPMRDALRDSQPSLPARDASHDSEPSLPMRDALRDSHPSFDPPSRDTQPSIEPPPPVIDVPVLSLRESQPALEVLAISPPPAPVPAPLASVVEAAPHAIDTATTEPNRAVATSLGVAPTEPNRAMSTSLGVAPLEPATVVRAPFVIDTPVPRRSPLPSAFLEHGRPEMARTASTPIIPTDGAAGAARVAAGAAVAVGMVVAAGVADAAAADTTTAAGDAIVDERGAHHSRTAMPALDPGSGLPRPGPWQAMIGGLGKTIRSVRWWLSRRRRSTQRIRRER